MARSKGVTISVKVPINREVMTDRTKQRLRQIVGRDTRVIRSFLGIIEQYENKLLTSRNKIRIDVGKLDQLTMTTLRVNPGYNPRSSVPHDLKARFRRISPNEFQECRDTAIGLYESYLKLRIRRRRKVSRPCETNASKRIPRWIFKQRFNLIQSQSSKSRYWLDLRDSLDSALTSKWKHDRLRIPLKVSPFHENQFSRGEVKALQIFTDNSGKWWITFAVRLAILNPLNVNLPCAVLGIDLGIEKAVCASIITPLKVSETRYFYQREKADTLRNLDEKVANLQRDLETRRNRGLPFDGVSKLLRSMKNKRESVAKEFDRVLVRQLVDYIQELSMKYTVHVAIGRLKHIRRAAKKGDGKGRRFRGMIHRWAFARITNGLKHQLAQIGWKVDGKKTRFNVVSEAWTSITCWKCGHRGIRPRQKLFICPTCGNKCNADMNGAVNIAGRLITLTSSLHGVRGRGKWDTCVKAAKSLRPKARGSKSRGKSLLSRKEQSSSSGESAAVHHAQTSLLSFSDDAEKGDNDSAVVRTVENLSVVENDASAVVQEKEAGSVGGIPSQ